MNIMSVFLFNFNFLIAIFFLEWWCCVICAASGPSYGPRPGFLIYSIYKRVLQGQTQKSFLSDFKK